MKAKLVFFALLLGLSSIQVAAQTTYLVYFKTKNVSQCELAVSTASLDRKILYRIPLDDRDYAIEKHKLDEVQKITPVIQASRWLNAVSVSVDEVQLDKIKSLSFVDRVEVLKKKDNTLKSAQHKLETNYTISQYGKAYEQLKIHNGKALHDLGYEGQGMKIAIFDAGFPNVPHISSYAHLFAEHRIFPVKNIVENTANLYTLDGHGTGTMGCMAAFIPDTIIGSAPKANYYLFITEDPRSESRIEEYNWAVAAEMADSIGIDIINSSLGYHQFDDVSQNYEKKDMDGRTAIVSKAAAIAVAKGIIVVSSAGNHGNKDWHIITAPADVEEVVSVGSVNVQGVVSDFSSRGPNADNIIKPSVVSVGQNTLLYYDQNGYHYGNGTSFASPLMAGLIACYWQKNKSVSPDKIRRAIYRGSSNYMNPNDDIGFGIPNFETILSQPEEVVSKKQLSVYPNPTKHFAILEINSTEEIPQSFIEVYFGHKRIFNLPYYLKKGINQVYFDTENFARGLYFFRVKFNNYVLEERLIKN